MVYDSGISSVLNNKLTYKFKVGKYLDKKYKMRRRGQIHFCWVGNLQFLYYQFCMLGLVLKNILSENGVYQRDLFKDLK